MNPDDSCDDKELDQKVAKSSQKKLVCKVCDYVTSKKCNFDKHLSSSKHCSRTLLNTKNKKATKSSSFLCQFCKKDYTARNSCWYHEKQCLDNPSNKPIIDLHPTKIIKKFPSAAPMSAAPMSASAAPMSAAPMSASAAPMSASAAPMSASAAPMSAAHMNETITISLSDLCKTGGDFCVSLQDMVPCMLSHFKRQNDEHQKEQKMVVQELLIQNKELMNTIREMTPRIGSNNVVNTTNNTQFNLNVFLNEECKDAIKLSDFVKSLNITVADLEFTKTNGIIEGVSSIIVNNLKGMDVHKRPIHCTDMKRETMYVKADEWVKDDTLEHVRKFIYLTSCYQTRVIQDWMAAHPGWESNEKMQTEYLTLCKELYKNIEKDDVAQRKILKGFIKEVQIDKSMLH